MVFPHQSHALPRLRNTQYVTKSLPKAFHKHVLSDPYERSKSVVLPAGLPVTSSSQHVSPSTSVTSTPAPFPWQTYTAGKGKSLRAFRLKQILMIDDREPRKQQVRMSEWRDMPDAPDMRHVDNSDVAWVPETFYTDWNVVFVDTFQQFRFQFMNNIWAKSLVKYLKIYSLSFDTDILLCTLSFLRVSLQDLAFSLAVLQTNWRTSLVDFSAHLSAHRTWMYLH